MPKPILVFLIAFILVWTFAPVILADEYATSTIPLIEEIVVPDTASSTSTQAVTATTTVEIASNGGGQAITEQAPFNTATQDY